MKNFSKSEISKIFSKKFVDQFFFCRSTSFFLVDQLFFLSTNFFFCRPTLLFLFINFFLCPRSKFFEISKLRGEIISSFPSCRKPTFVDYRLQITDAALTPKETYYDGDFIFKLQMARSLKLKLYHTTNTFLSSFFKFS